MYFNSNTSSPASWVQVQRTDNNGVGDGTSTGTKFIDGYPSAGQTTTTTPPTVPVHLHLKPPYSYNRPAKYRERWSVKQYDDRRWNGIDEWASAYSHSHGFTTSRYCQPAKLHCSAGTTASGNPPFLVVNYIIKY